ncbi:Rhomboid family protein [Rubripirellula obstinata]|uniref:Rhomboid family protein n=1 Tax=Rubripirellula obstinata TaxID=406547 RepID=A0A5B1CHN4_9BACT|nr:rhomboid family intramembrane serine protease [Rubripirellula obstinata]KAA1258754.1 Rhomboid family protein [Rubripirellula obstinata]
MDEAQNRTEVVFKTRSQQSCGEPQLVLASAGISSNLMQHDGWWVILVAPNDGAAALDELKLHQQDNAGEAPQKAARIPIFDGAMGGVGVYALVISMVMFCDSFSAYELPWRQLGRMQAGEVKAGQWWRVFTALTLHVDLQHLLSNLAFGGLFGLFAGRILGGGVAWLSIVLAGGIGNAINAVVRDADHSSIGASTAVFAALGILVSHALRPRTSATENVFRRWRPLIGGVLLLAFVGVGGERTDVVAHVTGFVSGVVIGWIACRVPDRFLANQNVQTIASVLAMVVIAICWGLAIGT